MQNEYWSECRLEGWTYTGVWSLTDGLLSSLKSMAVSWVSVQISIPPAFRFLKFRANFKLKFSSQMHPRLHLYSSNICHVSSSVYFWVQSRQPACPQSRANLSPGSKSAFNWSFIRNHRTITQFLNYAPHDTKWTSILNFSFSRHNPNFYSCNILYKCYRLKWYGHNWVLLGWID